MATNADSRKQRGKAPSERELRAEMAKHEGEYQAYLAARAKCVPRAKNPHAAAYAAYKRAYTALLAKGKGKRGKKRVTRQRGGGEPQAPSPEAA
jgi:hypothetical protein